MTALLKMWFILCTFSFIIYFTLHIFQITISLFTTNCKLTITKKNFHRLSFKNNTCKKVHVIHVLVRILNLGGDKRVKKIKCKLLWLTVFFGQSCWCNLFIEDYVILNKTMLLPKSEPDTCETWNCSGKAADVIQVKVYSRWGHV